MSRSGPNSELARLPETLPIFPLPGTLLLPDGRLPLNIFEPRYMAMVRDAIAGARAIGMIQPREAARDVGAARVYGTGCAGRIVGFEETDDGRYLIELRGIARFDVAEELPPHNGYRRVRADYTRFRRDTQDDETLVDRDRLLSTQGSYLDAAGIEGDWDVIEEADDAPLVTSLAMMCPFSAPEKQALLEAATLAERASTMTTLMEMALHAPDASDAHH
ncbi:MAG: LON peptidase substrate-binding domain-containing protein [Kiloniellaceae bacterium]